LNVHLDRDPITRTASIAAAVALGVVTVFVAGFGASAAGANSQPLSGSVVDQYKPSADRGEARVGECGGADQERSED